MKAEAVIPTAWARRMETGTGSRKAGTGGDIVGDVGLRTKLRRLVEVEDGRWCGSARAEMQNPCTGKHRACDASHSAGTGSCASLLHATLHRAFLSCAEFIRVDDDIARSPASPPKPLRSRPTLGRLRLRLRRRSLSIGHPCSSSTLDPALPRHASARCWLLCWTPLTLLAPSTCVMPSAWLRMVPEATKYHFPLAPHGTNTVFVSPDSPLPPCWP